MITLAGSKGVDADGVEYDHGFTIEIGRVDYTPNPDGSFETVAVFVKDQEEPRVEKRDMSAEDLQKWFDNPTPEYYEESIKPLPVK